MNKQRYWFAASSFARMFRPDGVTLEMRNFCKEWAEKEEDPPLGDLRDVDRYFLDMWSK